MTAQFQALPVLRSGMEVLVYENGQSTHPLDANLSVMYAGDTLTSATVEFVWDYLDDQDRLLFTEQNGITGSFDEANGVLTLTGTATVDQYQQALRGVEYTNTRVNPIASFKQLNVFVEDGNIFSASVGLLLVVDTEQVAPTIDIATTVVGFTEGTNPIFVAADLIISEHDQPREDGEGAVFLTGAEAFIDGYVPGEDLLTFDTSESEPDADGNIVFIDGQFDTNNGVLSLIGRATPEQYESVLRSIRYENVSAAPSVHPRELKISAAQGIALAIAPPVTITVTSLNDPPTRIVAAGVRRNLGKRHSWVAGAGSN